MGYESRLYPNRLKITRQNAGYQQQEVVKLLGHRSHKLLSQWENERSMPNGTELLKLCILYNRLPQELYPDYYDRLAQRVLAL